MKKSLEIIEKICIVGIIVLILVIVAGILFLNRNSAVEEKEAQVPGTEKEELSDELDFMPSGLRLGEKTELDFFQDASGNQVDLQDEYNGKTKILIFWGSWCSYCDKTLKSLREYSRFLDQYQDMELILINKTDPDKEESVEKAENYLKEQKLDFPCYYDKDLTGYHSYGIKRIPTILVIDGSGYMRDILVNTVESEKEWKEIFAQAQDGKASGIFQKIMSGWIGEEGQIYTEQKETKSSSPSGHDVLSESQGIMMEYAALCQDQELFEKEAAFLQKYMERENIYSWYVTQAGKQADSNALLDDLRIYKAMWIANEQWSDQEDKLKLLSDGILKHNTKAGELYSFYDFQQKMPGKEIALNYVDFYTLELLQEQQEAFSSICSNMKEIVENGYISDQVPLYYASYDYETKKYKEDSLHTAEELVTFYHLAQVGRLKETSYRWLKEQLSNNRLCARYGTDGKVVSGYEYESTAVYALAALIGIEEKDSFIYTRAIQRMELLMKQNADTENMRVFDLLMPMLAYAKGENVQFNK